LAVALLSEGENGAAMLKKFAEIGRWQSVANSTEKENETMKKYMSTLVVFLTLVAFALGAVQIAISGIGVGFSSDEAAADQSADQQAGSNLQMECMAGQIVSSFKSGDQCANLGDDDNPNYMCTVTYVGSCRVGR
jgi:hypothetical protein